MEQLKDILFHPTVMAIAISCFIAGITFSTVVPFIKWQYIKAKHITEALAAIHSSAYVNTISIVEINKNLVDYEIHYDEVTHQYLIVKKSNDKIVESVSPKLYRDYESQ